MWSTVAARLANTTGWWIVTGDTIEVSSSRGTVAPIAASIVQHS